MNKESTLRLAKKNAIDKLRQKTASSDLEDRISPILLKYYEEVTHQLTRLLELKGFEVLPQSNHVKFVVKSGVFEYILKWKENWENLLEVVLVIGYGSGKTYTTTIDAQLLTPTQLAEIIRKRLLIIVMRELKGV